MIHFVIYEDVLQYKIKINQIINSLNNIKYEIHDIKDKLNINKTDTYIFIIDLERENSLEYIEEINNKYNSNFYIIILSSHMSLSYNLLKRKLMIFDVICKFYDFEEKLKKDLNFILKRSIKDNISLYKDKIEIPKNEIDHITILKDKIIIKGTNINGEKYTYIIDDETNTIKDDINKHFICPNMEYTLFFKRNKFHLNVNLKISKNNTYVKPYKNEIKEEIIKLYNKGYKVSKLSKNYSISKSTIYNWIKMEKINIKIKKYDAIEKIVNN